jgi:hypothetical protein
VNMPALALAESSTRLPPYRYDFMTFPELSITSNFSFLTGASHPEEYMERAALLGLSAVAIADENAVSGIVRAHTKARDIARLVAVRQAAIAVDGPIGPPLPSDFAGRPPPSLDI